MSHHKSDDEIINKTHNTARYSVETRHVTWVLLIATCVWGIFGYLKMPQRKYNSRFRLPDTRTQSYALSKSRNRTTRSF